MRRTLLLAAALLAAALSGFLAGRWTAEVPRVPREEARPPARAQEPPPPAPVPPGIEGPSGPPVPGTAVPTDPIAPVPPAAGPPEPPPGPRSLTVAALYGIGIPERPTAADLRRALGEVGKASGKDPRQALREALLEALLRDCPPDAASGGEFHELFWMRLRGGDAGGARAAFDAYADRAGMREFQKENCLANLASARGDMEAYREHVQRSVDDPSCPESERASGEYWIGRTLLEGSPEDGRARLRNVVERYGSSEDEAIRKTVAAARAALGEGR